MDFCETIWRKVNEGHQQGQVFHVRPRKKQHVDSCISLLFGVFFFSLLSLLLPTAFGRLIKSSSLDTAFYLQLSVSGRERKQRSYVMELFDIQRNLKHDLQYYLCLLDICSGWTSGATVLCLPRAALFDKLAFCFAHKRKVYMASPFPSTFQQHTSPHDWEAVVHSWICTVSSW